MLQRLTEELVYSEILDKAATCEESTEQLVYVAAFTISVYSTTINRTTKPFNPLLGLYILFHYNCVVYLCKFSEDTFIQTLQIYFSILRG